MFALRDINLCKIESRPLRTAPLMFEPGNGRRFYNYLFFVDFVGSTAEVSSLSPDLSSGVLPPYMAALVSGPGNCRRIDNCCFVFDSVGSPTELGLYTSDWSLRWLDFDAQPEFRSPTTVFMSLQTVIKGAAHTDW